MEMSYCAPNGIPYSYFIGETRQPVWDKLSRDAAILYTIHQSKICRECGTNPEDFDIDKGGDRQAWEPYLRFCPGCAQLEPFAKEHSKKKDPAPGTKPGLRTKVEARKARKRERESKRDGIRRLQEARSQAPRPASEA